MARLLRLSTLDFGVLGLCCAFASLLVGAVALYGQATPSSMGTQWQPQQNTWNPSVGTANMATGVGHTSMPQTNTWSPQPTAFPNPGNSWSPNSSSTPLPGNPYVVDMVKE